MFTGIIENLGEVKDIQVKGTNRTFYIQSSLASELKMDESVSHNGVCLTVENIQGNIVQITAIHETLEKTNADDWKPGDLINLERAMRLNERLDGHIVQGHVDGTAKCKQRTDRDGSVEFTFLYNHVFAPLLIEKGSVCVNGVSLTAFNLNEDLFTVAIIPYTLEHTNFKNLIEDDVVNVEFDILGKYVQRILNLQLK